MQTWYYSNNGERQGPVSFEELKTMARSGRLNPTTDLAWAEGMTDWTPSGRIPGLFQDTDASNPYAAPTTPSNDLLAPVVGGEIAPGSYALDAMAVIQRSIELTKRHFWVLLGIGLVYWLLTLLVEYGFKYVFAAIAPPVAATTPASGSFGEIWLSTMAAQQSPTAMVLSIIPWVINTFLGIGLAKAALNVVGGKPIAVGTLFSQGDKLLRVLGAGILYGLMVGIGFVLLIFPGIYLALRFIMYQEAIIDKNMGVMESFRYSADLTQNNKMNLFVLGLLSMLVLLAGALALLVGLAFAVPVVYLAGALAYRVLQFGQRAMLDQPGTKTPQLLAVTGPY